MYRETLIRNGVEGRFLPQIKRWKNLDPTGTVSKTGDLIAP